MKSQALGVFLSACFLAYGVAIAQEGDVASRQTESQKILLKLMDDIRRCDKTVRYDYDSKTGQINPPELARIKGFKLKKLYRELAVFEIDERYEGLRARRLLVGIPSRGYFLPRHSIAFSGEFPTVRSRLEDRWNLRFEDGMRPGPDVIYDGLYAEITLVVDGKDRILSIEKMPPDVYPHITLPRVGCNHVAL